MEENIKNSMPNYENWTVEQLSDRLPKYIVYKNKYYSLIIHKKDWDGYEDNSWFAYYAKENQTGFRTQNALINVSGATLHKALINMINTYYEFKTKNIDDPKYFWKG